MHDTPLWFVATMAAIITAVLCYWLSDKTCLFERPWYKQVAVVIALWAAVCAGCLLLLLIVFRLAGSS